MNVPFEISDRAPEKHEKLISSLILVLSLCLLAIRVPLLFVRYFDQDEFEFFHAAWNMSHGLLIYNDFFENHPPAIHYLLQIPIWITGDTFTTLFFARIIMLLFVGAIVWLTYLLARRFSSRLTAAIAVLMLCTMVLFLEKTLEIRPDVPLTFCWVASLWFVMRGFDGKMAHFTYSGALLAIGLIFSPKIVFACLAISLTLCFLVWARPNLHWRCLLNFHLGLLITGLAFLLSLFLGGNLAEFWQTNVVLNSQISAQFRSSMLKNFALESFQQNILFWIAGVLGLYHLARLPRDLLCEKSILLVSLASLVGGLLVNPVPNKQNYLLFIPILSITSALFLVSISSAVFRWKRTAGGALAIILVALALLPLRGIHSQFSNRNDDQFEVIRYVLENTTPEETVFDSWTRMYLFRRNAFYYHYLNMDILSVLDKKVLERLPEALVSNNCKVVLVDRHFRYLPVRVRQFIAQNYHQSPAYPWILFRNEGAFETKKAS
jgi:4-amino-4-deoxy-L-arabinose transferase-like glycosyltransferase